MIPVVRKPEPDDFAQRVRQPGQTFLAGNSPQSSREFEPYWRRVKRDLHEAYDNICAYTCIYLVSGTVDHFLPKSRYPLLAYEWDNYRLASNIVNQNKSDSIGLLDPFKIEDGWFALDFPTCYVVIGDQMPNHLRNKAKQTIGVLKLNSNQFAQLRFRIIKSFWNRDLDWRTLQRRYPFLASELERQNLRNRGHIRRYFQFR